MNTVRFLDVIAGHDQSAAARCCRAGLSLLAAGYGLATEVRNWTFDRGFRRVHHVSVPVISIGNLTTGGVGKTPTVAWLVRWLSEQGRRPAIVSRGYKSLDDGVNDEKLLLDQLCPDAPHVQNPDRFQASLQAIQRHAANVIVLDDGFQHRRLFRDVDLVLIDALNPWGYGRLLPRGLLRERMGGLHRAHAILITRCDLAEETGLHEIQETVSRFSSAPIFRTAFLPTRLINNSGVACPLDSLRSANILAFCGIGNPQGFRKTLNSVGASVAASDLLEYPDHHHYSSTDLEHLERMATERNATMAVTTRKDLVKIRQPALGITPLWGVEIELSFLDSPRLLLERIEGVLNQEV